MSLRSQIGQQLIIGLSGPSLTVDEKKFIIENNIGGVVLFGRNLQTPEQIRDLCAEVQSLRFETPDKTPLFISIDMEGGRINRLSAPFTQWPSLKKLGDLDNPTVAFHFSQRMGVELMAVGINVDFAPCVDVFTNPKNTVIGDRAISNDPHKVERMVSALIRGYIKSGIISCAKHFPGHGETVADSHLKLPVENATLDRLNSVELIPFRKALRSRVDMVMTSHIHFKNIDAKWPVTFSEFFLKQLIREEMKFRGLVITDDLGMKAIADNYEAADVPVLALKAGADILLYCNEPEAPPVAMDSILDAVVQGRLQKADLEASYRRIMDLKKLKLLSPDPKPIEEINEIIGQKDHLELAESIENGVMPQGLTTNE
jgi:beta-N-acetylhexosaminidase